ncbi:MAG: hypothetical protein ACQETH_17500, partial [Candidatus Rifleibacteriota bacterium]
KHECFSEGLLTKETMAEKDSLCSLCALWLFSLCFEAWFEEYSFRKPTDRRLPRIATNSLKH